MYPKVSIIILNWNGWKDTIECLESLFQINYQNYNVILVDNGSEDNSLEKIREYCKGKLSIKSDFFKYNSNNKPLLLIEYSKNESEVLQYEKQEIIDLKSDSNLTIIKCKKNNGFAEGSNIGIRHAMKYINPNYILLLNNDTVVDKEFLEKLVDFAEKENKAGVVGSKTYFYDTPNTIQNSWNKINFYNGKIFSAGYGELDKEINKEIVKTDYVSGVCFLIKRDLLKKIGLLDPAYFAYWEDLDYSMRAKLAGYDCYYIPEAKIWHKVSQSSKKFSDFTTYLDTRNMIWFMKTYANTKQYFVFFTYFFVFRFFIISGSIIICHKNFKNFKAFFNGVLDGIKLA
ncbi:MAG: hypothetical protein CIT01_00105 [Methanobacterium sp. BRmetb2]|nr:MAG: hypothetical protein CIT01_00105 [Methanobacterium sp. BRmetb2]